MDPRNHPIEETLHPHPDHPLRCVIRSRRKLNVAHQSLPTSTKQILSINSLREQECEGDGGGGSVGKKGDERQWASDLAGTLGLSPRRIERPQSWSIEWKNL